MLCSVKQIDRWSC